MLKDTALLSINSGNSAPLHYRFSLYSNFLQTFSSSGPFLYELDQKWMLLFANDVIPSSCSPEFIPLLLILKILIPANEHHFKMHRYWLCVQKWCFLN